MADTRVNPSALGIIRIAMLGGVLLFGAIIAYLHTSGTAPDASGSPLGQPVFSYAFFALCAAAAAAMMMLRGAAERAGEPQRRAPIVIAAWAVGEGVAILGAVHWLLTGTPTLYVVGLFVFIVGLLTVSAGG